MCLHWHLLRLFACPQGRPHGPHLESKAEGVLRKGLLVIFQRKADGCGRLLCNLKIRADAETVIAINTDPKAPIFDYADYGIVGDWETVIDQFLEEELL